jgi:hypothetical protein
VGSKESCKESSPKVTRTSSFLFASQTLGVWWFISWCSWDEIVRNWFLFHESCSWEFSKHARLCYFNFSWVGENLMRKIVRVLERKFIDQEHEIEFIFLWKWCCPWAFGQNGCLILGFVLDKVDENILVFLRILWKLFWLWIVFWKCFVCSKQWFWELVDYY